MLGHPVARVAEPVGELREVEAVAQRLGARMAGGDRREIEDGQRKHARRYGIFRSGRRGVPQAGRCVGSAGRAQRAAVAAGSAGAVDVSNAVASTTMLPSMLVIDRRNGASRRVPVIGASVSSIWRPSRYFTSGLPTRWPAIGLNVTPHTTAAPAYPLAAFTRSTRLNDSARSKRRRPSKIG